MSKRSRESSFSSSLDESFAPVIEDEADALAGHPPPTKLCQINPDVWATRPARVMQCMLAPHRETVCFATQEEYEVHYIQQHTNRCATCSKNFPSPRFLELHIEENHNALREALAARGEKTYGCFVEDCDRKCSTPQKRRFHLIDKHMFPRTYNFRIVDQGIDKASSMLQDGRRRRVSTANDSQQVGRQRRQTLSQLHNQPRGASEDKNHPTDDNSESIPTNVEACEMVGPARPTTANEPSEDPVADLDNVTQSLSALRFVPTSVLRKNKQKGRPPKNSN